MKKLLTALTLILVCSFTANAQLGGLKINKKHLDAATKTAKALTLTDDQNAFACANGSIRVFAGLMELLTDDEILGIVGHEVGHIVNKDSKDAFKKALLTSALKDAVASTSDAAATLTDSQLGELGEALASAQFSQKAEYAADDYGYEFLKKSGKDPMGMVTALRVIQKLSDDAGVDKSKAKQLFSTHPESGKRADKLEAKYKKEYK